MPRVKPAPNIEEFIKKLPEDIRYQLWKLLISKTDDVEYVNRSVGHILFWEGPQEAHAICNCPPKKEKQDG